MPFTLYELAGLCGARIKGDPACNIKSVNTLQSAGEGDISFLSNRRYARYLPETRASAVILTEKDIQGCKTNALLTNDPYLAYAKIASHLYPQTRDRAASDDKSISTGDDCRIDDSVFVASGVVIGHNVSIGPHTHIGPGCVIQDNVNIGESCLLVANVTLCRDVSVAERVILHPGVVIGADGFGFARENGAWLKIPQIGAVRLSEQVEVGANSTIDRGAIEDTIIEAGVKIDNQVQIGHNAILGENTIIAGNVSIAGSAVIGKRCMIGGGVCIDGHLEVADDVTITAMSGVTGTIPSAGVYSSGAVKVMKHKVWQRNVVRFNQLDSLIRKIMKKLEKI